MRKNIRNKGSITVEAALVVPIFAMCMITLAFFMKLVYIQETMQNSLNHTANSISQYSYLYSKSGLQDYVRRIDDASNQSVELVEKQKEDLLNAIGMLNSFEVGQAADKISSDDLKNVIQKTKDVKDDPSAAFEEFKGNAKMEGIAIICYIGNGVKEQVSPQISKSISKYLFIQELNTSDKSAADKLKGMNIVGGKDGLDFTGTDLNNGYTTKIEVTYDVELPLPIRVIDKFTLRNQAYVKNWIGS